MLSTVAAALLALACPEHEPAGFDGLPHAARAKFVADCAELGDDPVWLGRLRRRTHPFVLAAGLGTRFRDDLAFIGPEVKLGLDLRQVLIALTFRGEYHSGGGAAEAFALSAGLPVRLGEWLLRPTVSFSVIRSEVGELVPYRGWVLDGGMAAGAEILLPNRYLGLAIEGGVDHPIAANLLKAWKPAAHVSASLVWYLF